MRNPVRVFLSLYRDLCAVRNFYKPSAYTSFKGIYTSFEEALATVPPQYKLSYNDAELSEEYKTGLLETLNKGIFQLRQYDYPLLLWLKEITKEKIRIADFGGNTGVHFYTYTTLVAFPENIKWTVIDLPEIVKEGNQVKVLYPDSRLEFRTRLVLNEYDVLVASGSLQYIPFEEVKKIFPLSEYSIGHILINRMPLYDGPGFVTLQNGGKVFYPQHVYNRKEFLCFFEERGYELIDEWEDTIDRCIIPFHASHNIHKYTGLYLRKKKKQ